MSFFAFLVSVAMGVGSLAYAYSRTDIPQILPGILTFGLFWLYAGWKRWNWVSSLGILILVALAGYGLWIELSTGWMIAGALGGLMAWDLGEFMRRLDVAPESEDLPAMQRRHIARLTLVALLGLSLASIAMLLRVEFTLEWMMLLALIAVLGLTQLVAWLRRN
jgi:hypothetical protein